VDYPKTLVQTLKIAHGSVLTTVYSLQKKVKDSTLSQDLNTVGIPKNFALKIIELNFRFFLLVWCWGWDGAGELDGPDVDPIWERVSNKSMEHSAVLVQHDRSLLL
jgi:hypothetical protein